MKYFHQIGTNLPIAPILDALHFQQDLWDKRTFRQNARANAETECIFLRYQNASQEDLHFFNTAPKFNWEAMHRGLECVDLEEYDRLPEVRPVVNAVMAVVGAERLGRVILVKLPPRSRVYPHNDAGNYADYYQRICIPLQSLDGNFMREGDETVYMRPGEAWFINLEVEHEAWNDSDDDRITLFMDVKLRDRNPLRGLPE